MREPPSAGGLWGLGRGQSTLGDRSTRYARGADPRCLADVDRTISLVHGWLRRCGCPRPSRCDSAGTESSMSAPFFARRFEEAGVAGVTIHGRTRGQGFGRLVNLEDITGRREGGGTAFP